MNLHLPQILYLMILVLSLGINLAKHGEPKGTKYNFFTDLISSIIIVCFLYWGGFFK